MLLRLAGMGLRGLGKGVTNPGAVGKIVRGVGTTAAELGVLTGLGAAGSTAIDLGLNDGIYNRQQELLNEGPKEDGTYRINLGDKINSGISGFFGGDTIDPASMKTAKGNRNFQEINKPENALLKAALIEQGVDLSKAGRGTENILSLSAEFAEPIAATKRKKKFDAGQDEYRTSQAYLDAVTEREYNKGVQETARKDRLSREKQARLDSLDNRADSLALAMADLDFKKGESNRNYDFRTKELEYDAAIKKDARRAKILSALGGLGMMFAV